MRCPGVSVGADFHPSLKALANDFQHWLPVLSLFQLRPLHTYVMAQYIVNTLRFMYLRILTPSSTKLHGGTPFVDLSHLPLIWSCFHILHAIPLRSHLYQ
jgi:hypothetical protein